MVKLNYDNWTTGTCFERREECGIISARVVCRCKMMSSWWSQPIPFHYVRVRTASFKMVLCIFPTNSNCLLLSSLTQNQIFAVVLWNGSWQIIPDCFWFSDYVLLPYTLEFSNKIISYFRVVTYIPFYFKKESFPPCFRFHYIKAISSIRSHSGSFKWLWKT